MDWLKTDDLTVVLAVSFVAVYALSKLLKPQSLVHPLLLGRQADVGRVRLVGESAVYRNYATGHMGTLPERPKPEVKFLSDLIPDNEQAVRTLWSTRITNAELKARADALGNGLTQVAGLVPGDSTALVLLDDSLELLVTDIALANNSIISFTLSSISLLTPALEKHSPGTIIVHVQFLGAILEHIADLRQSAHHSIVVIGDREQNSSFHSHASGVRIFRWEDLEAKGKTLRKLDVPPLNTDNIISVALFGNSVGELRGAEISHANLTAGVTAGRLFFPLGDLISQKDTLLSTFSLKTPFGRSIAYTALYQGANFLTSIAPLRSEDDGGAPTASETSQLIEDCDASPSSPTILFITPEHLQTLTNSILKSARSNPLFGLAWRHKLSGLREGFLARVTFWDNLIFDGARAEHLGKSHAVLRGVVVSGGHLENAALDPARVAFSVPIVSTYSSPLVCGPVLTSHPLDMQSFPPDTDPHITVAHAGPPAPNVEVKLVNVLDSSVEKGGDPTGELAVRGPSVVVPIPEGASSDGWVVLGQKARAQTNGTFKVL